MKKVEIGERCSDCKHYTTHMDERPCLDCSHAHVSAKVSKFEPVFKGLEHAYDEQIVEAHEILAEGSQSISHESMAETLKKLEDPGAHYRHFYKGIELDPYRIALVYALTDHMEFFILKKVLRMGSAHKDKRQELKDIINAAQRRLDVLEEGSA